MKLMIPGKPNIHSWLEHKRAKRDRLC